MACALRAGAHMHRDATCPALSNLLILVRWSCAGAQAPRRRARAWMAISYRMVVVVGKGRAPGWRSGTG